MTEIKHDGHSHGNVHNKPKMKIKKTLIWQAISAILLILLFASIYTCGFKTCSADLIDTDDKDETESNTEPVSLEGASVILINDKRCVQCDTTQLVAQLKSTLPGIEIAEVDYSNEAAKQLYEENGLTVLPAVLFTEDIKENENYAQIESYMEEKTDYLSLRIGASFDPEAEICDNEIDDNGDGAIDCDDETCKSEWQCMEKKDKPVVEAFVMSHCPYGTQIEKGLIPVIETLKDKADIQIKFCNYAMHGETEIKEELVQYCIQEEQNDKYIDYLSCFLKEGDGASCLAETGIDTEKLEACKTKVDEEYSVMDNLNDKSKWMGNFPPFMIHDADNQKYGVRGSPSLVINGVVASSGRDSASLLDAICTGFKTEPEECSEELSSTPPSPGFGFESTGTDSTATCG